MLLVLKFFALSYGALLPVINPVGSALMLLTVVGDIPYGDFRRKRGGWQSAWSFSFGSLKLATLLC
jgi:hypothetical protein